MSSSWFRPGDEWWSTFPGINGRANSARMERGPPVVGTQDVEPWSDSANEHIQKATRRAAKKPDT